MNVETFYISKESLMSLIDEWLDDFDITKIEIFPVYEDEHLVWVWSNTGEKNNDEA